jgi:hypothetical protein
MAEYLVTYDFKVGATSQYRTFVLCAEPQGLLYVYRSDDLFRLTNTTLWGEFATKENAKTAFDNAQAAAENKLGSKIILEKRMITRISDYFVRSDKRKAPEKQWMKASDLETCRAHQLNDPFFAY